MKYLRHLFRQPLKTVTGIILVTIAVAILCVSVGQAYAVRSTEKNLHDQFTTVAIPSDTITMPEDLLSWLQTAAEAYPDIIKTIAKQNFISANIPGMTAMNFTNGNFIDDTQGALSKYTACPYPDGRPYTCAMLVVTVDEIGDAKELGGRVVVSEKLEREDFAFNEDYLEWKKNEMETMNFTYGFTQNFIGTVNQVVSLQEGFRDPTGMKVILTVSASTRKELNDCKLKPGEQYIVYSMSYYDEDWLIRSSLAAGTNSYNDFPIEIDAFDLSKFDLLTSAQRENYKKSYNVTAAPFALYDGRVYLGESDYKNANAVSMRLYSALPDRDFEIIRDGEKGKLIEIKYRTEYTYKDGDNYVICTEEEYKERYKIPTVAKLKGSVEDFLNSAEGAEWKAALERDAVNNSSFAVIGVDKLSYLFDFARGYSKITEGRDFTADELEQGSRVCIIHEALAEANGLQIGDTLPMNFFETDTSMSYDKMPNGSVEYLNPSSSFYFKTTPFTETAEYTIVGFWRGEELWPDMAKNEFGLSPNVIIVPNGSTETEMEHKEGIIYTTPVIHNGKLSEFRALSAEAGYDDRFMYFDRGYSVLMKNFFNYENLAVQVLAIGATIYSIIILLFLLLYTGSHSKAVKTMESLGVPYLKRSLYVLISSMSIVAVSSVLGIFMGFALWKWAVVALQTTADAASALTVRPLMLVLIVIAQFFIVLLLNILASFAVSLPKKMSARR